MTSYCLNPSLVLNLWSDIVLQSITTLTANFSFIKILLQLFVFFVVFFHYYLIHIYVSYDRNDILL